MASKSVFQEFDTDALTHFGIDNPTYVGLDTGSGVEKVLFIKDSSLYKRIQLLLTTGNCNKQTWVNHKRAFVLPKAPISLDRIKTAAKENSITITNDYTKADFIILHDNVSSNYSSGETLRISQMLFKLWNYNLVTFTNKRISYVDNYVTENDIPVIVTEYSYSDQIEETIYDDYIITGLALNIAYLIDTNAVDAIDVDDFIMESNITKPLTEETLELLKTMVDSYNDDDIEIAAKLIPTIDPNQNKHLLWNFFESCGYSFYKFNRNKDVQNWLSNSDFETLRYLSAEKMLLYLEKSNELNKENFNYLEPIIRKNIRIENRALYKFKVHVKDEYKQYLR